MADRPLLLGHRGSRKEAPENTLAAFKLALEHGCDGFEFDVRLTGDSQCVICHDPKLRGHEIAECTFAQLGATASDLATLERVIERFSGSAFLNIELKVTGAEAKTLELLKQHPASRGCIISSFLPEAVLASRRMSDEFPLGLICETRRQFSRWCELPIQAVMLQSRMVSWETVEELHAAGKQVFVWTVNNASEMKKFADMGVDGIISDDTKLLAAVLRPV